MEALIAWCSPLGEARAEHPIGDIWPFIMIRRSGGGESKNTDHGRYSVHVLAPKMVDAQEKASEVHRRIKLLASPWSGPQGIEISTGTVYPDDVKVVEGFRLQDYINDAIPQKIYRYTAIYEIPFRYR